MFRCAAFRFHIYKAHKTFSCSRDPGYTASPESSGHFQSLPGDNVEMTIELIHPVAMEQGLTFAIREGGRTVGSGRVATIIE